MMYTIRIGQRFLHNGNKTDENVNECGVSVVLWEAYDSCCLTIEKKNSSHETNMHKNQFEPPKKKKHQIYLTVIFLVI